jgi:4-hydroxyphenylpyruvate dioxygenase
MELSIPPAVSGIDYVEIYVSNCHQAAHYYRTALGFTIVGEVRQDAASMRTSILVEQHDVRLLLTAPLTAGGEVAEHIHLHGEGIKDIAFAVADARSLFDRAVAWGARALRGPQASSAERDSIITARIGASGDLVHSLVERSPGSAWQLPGLVRFAGRAAGRETGLMEIDHLAMAVAAGELDPLIDFYVGALGFEETHQENVTTEYSAMRSKVVQTPNGKVRFPIMAPAPGLRPSQIQRYIDSHSGPGVQHLAFRSDDIVRSAAALGDALEFLQTPDPYYDALEARIGDLGGDERQALRRHGILADRDATGILLQVFTKPIGTRPTLFLEVIERRGAQGFGGGNIRALFEAVERSHGVTAGSESGPRRWPV